MPQQPTTSTDRLANVIEVIQLGHKTGILMAERVTGSVLEQGVITFINGQVFQASIGHHKGLPAFNVLKTWGACRFAFTPSDPPQITQPLPPVSGDSSAFRALATDPTLPAQAMVNHKQSDSTPMMAQGRQGEGSIQPDPPSSRIHYPILPYEEALARIERLGLSRAHRRLFLLIDGYRTFPELVRLMGRVQEEVNALLRDLEGAGLIRRT
jgi:hypothetical protein